VIFSIIMYCNEGQVTLGHHFFAKARHASQSVVISFKDSSLGLKATFVHLGSLKIKVLSTFLSLMLNKQRSPAILTILRPL